MVRKIGGFIGLFLYLLVCWLTCSLGYGASSGSARKPLKEKILLAQGTDRPDLDVSLINKNIFVAANAIVRYDRIKVSVGYVSGVHLNRQRGVTVLNAAGQRDGRVEADYDKEEPLVRLSASIYDAHGKFVKAVHERDFEDYSYDDQVSMFNDTRYKQYVPAISDYPYTVLYEEDSRVKNSLYLPRWYPQYHEYLAVEQGSFELHAEKDISLHFHQQLLSDPVIVTGVNEKVYTWQLRDRLAFKVEASGPAKETYRPELLVSTDNFKIKGMSGSCSSWETFGKWEYENFLKDAAVLSQTTIDQVRALTSVAKDEKIKARLIYQYMQRKAHYVGIQIGIGGIKTEPASLVDEKGYGDCKGLANYTRALMKVCGIEAYYAEVYAGESPIRVYPEFAALGFSNHIILCLPFKNDTCWLECTSQEMPFNFVGNFTDNRPAILITPEGGKLVHTHRYPDAGNQQNRQAALTLTAGGDVSGTLTTQFTGLEYEDRDGIKEMNEEKRIERFKQIYALNRLEINHCSLDYKKEGTPLLTESLAIEIPQFAEMTDKSMLVPASPFIHTGRFNFSRNKRTVPVIVLRGSVERDSISYILPLGYKPESLLADTLKSDFGCYSVTCSYQGNTLLCASKYEIKSGSWDATRYEEYIRFQQRVSEMSELGVRVLPVKY